MPDIKYYKQINFKRGFVKVCVESWDLSGTIAIITEYCTIILHKSKFNPPRNDAAIELYLSLLEEKILSLGPIEHKYNNLTIEERKALYKLRNDTSTIIKDGNKGSVVVLRNKDYLKQDEEQSSFREMSKEVTDNLWYLIRLG